MAVLSAALASRVFVAEHVSTPGAYGAYPFLDFDHHYIGMLVRQGSLGTFQDGLRLFRAVQDLATQWADDRCAP